MIQFRDIKLITSEAERDGRVRGSVIVVRDGLAWEAVFGSMGAPIIPFLAQCNADYIAGKFETDRTEIDWAAIQRKTGAEDLDVTTAYFYSAELREHYGDDWMMDLPRRDTPRFRAALLASEALIAWAIECGESNE